MMKCIAIDDEPLALSQISSYISRVSFLTLVKSCRDAFDAMKVLSEDTIDLIFVDINMPDLNGMDFIRSLVNRPLVIFTTAYSEYAVDGFKVDAVDYLLKPFEFQDLYKASEKARKQHEYIQMAKEGEIISEDSKVKDGVLFVKSDYKVVRIDVDKIKYIESMSEYVRIFVEGEKKSIITLVSMQKLEARLPKSYFMRVHRSYIVNLRKMIAVSRMRILYSDEVYIPVGDSYKDKFLDYLEKMSIS